MIKQSYSDLLTLIRNDQADPMDRNIALNMLLKYFAGKTEHNTSSLNGDEIYQYLVSIARNSQADSVKRDMALDMLVRFNLRARYEFEFGSINYARWIRKDYKNNKTRLDIDQYFLRMAYLVSRRGTCARRRVGCIITNKANHIIATGYNGVASGQRHCIDSPCEGATAKSGESLHMCQAIHAEENAIMQCRDITSIDRVYVTASPCISCMRKLLNTSCTTIVFHEAYPHVECEKIWTDAGRFWLQRDIDWSI